MVQVRAEGMLGLCVVVCPFAALFAPFPFGAVREDALCSGRPLFLRVREGGAARMEGLPRIPEGRGEEEPVGLQPLASISWRKRMYNC